MNESAIENLLKKTLVILSKYRRSIFNLSIILLIVFIVIPQLGKLRSSFGIAQKVNLEWLLVGFMLSLLTFLLSALSFYALAKKPISYYRTVLTQCASMFANHLFPAGIGSIGVVYKYLRKNNHTKSEAATVIYVNNVLGFIGYVLIISFIVIFIHAPLHIHTNSLNNEIVLISFFSILLISFVMLYKHKKLRLSVHNFMNDIRLNTLDYKNKKFKLLISLVSIMGLTTLYALSLSACVLAVGGHINIAEALVVLAIGVVGKTVVPTPGGVIGAEAGIFAGLVTYGMTSIQAVVVVVAYRLVTYWIPFAIGAVAFAYVKRKQYL